MGIVNERIIFSVNLDEDKIIIPISSFSAHLYNGLPSYMSATIPDYHQYIDEIRAKMNGGIMMIEKSIDDEVSEVFWVDIENAEMDETGNEKILILSGHRIYINPDPQTVNLTGIEYIQKVSPATEPALLTMRCNIQNSVNPGDTVTYGEYEFIASEVIISGYGNRLTMELKEENPISSQGFFYPSVSADDYYWDLFGFSNDETTLYVGDMSNAGVCFKDIMIPQGATITSAIIIFILYYASEIDIKMNIYGNDVDNASPPEDETEAEALILTDAYIPWENLPILPEGYQYSTPDLSNIVQEIINREGWISGNSLQILLKDNGSGFFCYRQLKSIDAGVNYRPRLLIIWEA